MQKWAAARSPISFRCEKVTFLIFCFAFKGIEKSNYMCYNLIIAFIYGMILLLYFEYTVLLGLGEIKWWI